jgi:hypothetical protein
MPSTAWRLAVRPIRLPRTDVTDLGDSPSRHRVGEQAWMTCVLITAEEVRGQQAQTFQSVTEAWGSTWPCGDATRPAGTSRPSSSFTTPRGSIPRRSSSRRPRLRCRFAPLGSVWAGFAVMTTLVDRLVSDELWAKAGVFERLHLDRLGEQGRLDWSRASVDSASVRAKRGGPRRRKSGRSRQAWVQDPAGL